MSTLPINANDERKIKNPTNFGNIQVDQNI